MFKLVLWLISDYPFYQLFSLKKQNRTSFFLSVGVMCYSHYHPGNMRGARTFVGAMHFEEE